jgi:hypothetical protein
LATREPREGTVSGRRELGSNLTQSLTENFYAWEKRGRGWCLAPYPVELEPPFEPFFHYRTRRTAPVDDSRKPTLLSLLAEVFTGPAKVSEDRFGYEQKELSEVEPEPYGDDSAIRELRLVLPAKQKVTLDSMEALLLNLSSCAFPLCFEIIGTHTAILIQLACRVGDTASVRQQLKAYFPEATVDDQTGYLAGIWRNESAVAVDFGLSKEFMRPLRRIGNLETDPLIGIIGALENLEPGEVGILQTLFQPVRHPWAESVIRSVTDWEGNPFFADAPEMVPLAKEKVKQPLYAAMLRIGACSAQRANAWGIARAMASGLRHLADPQSNELIPLTNDDYDDLEHEAALLTRRSHRTGMLLNSEELVSLVHLPSVTVRAEKFVRVAKKTKAAPFGALGHRLLIGENEHQGFNLSVGLSQQQRLRHLYMVGATGTGKSTLLHNLIIQDVCHGEGVAVLDPHGDLIDKILGNIPEERLEDVILIDPADSEYPVGLNILTSHSEVEMNVLSSDLVAVFRRLSTSWGDQMNSVFGNAILAFLESDRGGTLSDLRRFLVEADYRKSFLTTVKDQEIVYYWLKEFPFLSGKPQGPILTRLDTFLRPKLIRNMVSQKEGLNFEKILDGKKIFLAKLSQGLIGEENAYLLGTLLVSKIQQAAMARQQREASDRNPFYLYIDEFQNFITPSMASILSGARKYGLGLVLAHQELRQLWNRDTEVANSVLSNPGTRICFRLGDFDAQKLAEGFSAFDAADLQNLKIGEAVCRMERIEQDFNLTTVPLADVDPEIAKARRTRAIELSRKKHARPRAEVETRLAGERALVIPAEHVTAVPEAPPVPLVPKKACKAPSADPRPEETRVVAPPPVMEGKGGPQHKYLQALIKRMAEEKGFRAIIEKTLPGGGSVDVSIERDGGMIACEISETTSDSHELKNIEKCLTAGYAKVIICSQERKFLEKVRVIAEKGLKSAEFEKVLYLQPEELYFLLEEEVAGLAGKEERVKGYRVKTSFSPVREGEKKTKREAVAKVILGAMKRMKDGME